MSVIYNTLLLLLFSVFFTMLFFAIERLKTISWFVKTKIKDYTIKIVEGSLYGIIILGLTLLMHFIYKNNIAYWLIAFFALCITRNVVIGTITLIPSSIYFLVTMDITISMYIIYIFIFLSLISLTIAIFFSNNFISRVVVYPIMLLLSLIFWLTILLAEFTIPEKGVGDLIFTVMGCIFTELLLFWFVKTSISANLLYESNNFVFSKYYRQQVKNRSIGENIVDNKIKKAIYGLFDINVFSDNKQEINEVKETILINLEKKLPENVTFFQSENGKYGVFMPTDIKFDIKNIISDIYSNKKNDQIEQLKKYILNDNSNYKTASGNFVKTQINMGISIYGVQSNSLEELENNSMFALKYMQEGNKNKIRLFDPNEYKIRLNEIKDLGALDESLDLSNLFLSFTPISSKENINVVEFNSNSNKESIVSMAEYVESHDLINIYNRYLAVEALKVSSNYKGILAIPYSFGMLDSKMNIAKFIQRIKKLKFKPSKLIIYSHINEVKNKEILKENFSKLREEGIKFAFTSTTTNDEEKVKYYNPDYLFIKKIRQNTLIIPEKTIYFKVENDLLLKKALKNNIKFLGGDSFSVKTKPHIFPKQSKIYIEEFLKRSI